MRIKYIGLTIAAMAGLSAQTAAQTSFDDDSRLASDLALSEAKCKADWPADYTMQKYCLDKNKTAYRQWEASKSENDTISAIRQYCSEQWTDDFSMRVYCFQNEGGSIGDVVKLMKSPNSEIQTITRLCTEQWEPQYSMALYCANKQIDAYKSLQ